jgi:hypothetical protein
MRYKRGVLAVLVVLILVSLVFSPGLSADEKSNSGADLKIIDIYPDRYYYASRSWYIKYYAVVKNIGDTTYEGHCAKYGCIRGIFNPNHILTELSNNAYKLYKVLPNEEVTIGFLSSPNYPYRAFFYEVHCEISTEEGEINKLNNIKNNIMFMIGPYYAFDFF